MPLLSIKVRHIGASKNGLRVGVLGLGAVTAALVVGGLSERVDNGSVVRWRLVPLPKRRRGPGGGAEPRHRHIAMLALGGGFLSLTASHQNAVHVLTEDRDRGRILALWLTLFGACHPIGSLIQGNLSDVVGVRAALLGAAVLFACSSFVRARRLFKHLP